MESFRYLSGEDFVGLVFCSTLDGKYMEAWNYTGERIVPITVKTRREWLKHGDDLSNASYQAIQFSETIMTRTTYTGEEKKCEYHGTFSCECLDEAIVRTCSKCKSSLEPEKTCDCVLCIKCGKYIQPGIKCITCCCQDCGKFLLSGKNCDCKNICKDCEKQKPCPCDPNACPQCPSKSCSCRLCHSATCWGKCSSGGNTGGGYIPPPIDPVIPPGGNVTPPEYPKSPLQLTKQEYFVPYKISQDCMKGCIAIMGNYGVSTGSSANVYQLMFERDGVLGYYNDQNYKDTYDKAIRCIDRHLGVGRPIVVGVDHTIRYGINEGTTDHWIIIAGRGYDHVKQQNYYTYMDTGRSVAADGCSTTDNRLYYDPVNHIFKDSVAGYKGKRAYNVTQVRPNDGQHLNETNRQPARP